MEETISRRAEHQVKKPLVAFLFLVRPGTPNSVLAPFVAMPGAPNVAFLLLRSSHAMRKARRLFTTSPRSGSPPRSRCAPTPERLG